MSMGIYKNPPQTYGFGVYIGQNENTRKQHVDTMRTMGFTLYPEDVVKLSPGIHTLTVDSLGDDTYAPPQGCKLHGEEAIMFICLSCDNDYSNVELDH